jgi:hypothetical protein
MVAKITTPGSIHRALNYNEKKVQNGKAECMYAGNFLMDAREMNFYQKLDRFKSLIELNQRAKTNTLHISLNFDPKECYAQEKLKEIATMYMGKIGFGQQPYLVYQHHDAGHPHIHIVTTSIRNDGKRIDTYNIGRNQSERARQEIEESFGLIKAKGRDKKVEEASTVGKIIYGKNDTKRSIVNVLQAVLPKFKYSSLPELNAILKQYNLVADRGREDGRIYKNRGLHYRILDTRGNKVGVPIKASSIYFKPTLGFLEKKYKENEELKAPFRQKLKTAIEWTLSKKPNSISEFAKELEKEKIATILRTNEQSYLYGITFVDFRTSCVYNGSELGKQFSAAALQSRILTDSKEKQNSPTPLQSVPKERREELQELLPKHPGNDLSKAHSTMLEQLLKTEKPEYKLPYGLTKKKRRKRPRL